MTHPFKTALAALAAATLLAGCSGQVDLVARRSHYDGYLDLAARGQAVASQDQALMAELLQHCEAPDLAPYPALQAEVGSMQRQAGLLEEQRQSLAAFEQDYDAFSATQPTVGPKDPAWPRYSQLDGRFTPIGSGVRQALQAVDASHQRFQGALADAGIARMDADALRKEINDFLAQLARSLDGMEQGFRDGRRQAADMGNAGGDDGWQRRRNDLRALEQTVNDAEAFRHQAAEAAQTLGDSLPTGTLYFGPGMDGGDSLAALRRDEEGLRRYRHGFDQEQGVLAADCQLAASAPQADAGWQGPAPAGGYAAAGGMPAAASGANGGGGPAAPLQRNAGNASVSAPTASAQTPAPAPSPVATPVAAAPTAVTGTAKPGAAPKPAPGKRIYGHGKAQGQPAKPVPKPNAVTTPVAGSEPQKH